MVPLLTGVTADPSLTVCLTLDVIAEVHLLTPVTLLVVLVALVAILTEANHLVVDLSCDLVEPGLASCSSGLGLPVGCRGLLTLLLRVVGATKAIEARLLGVLLISRIQTIDCI